MNMTRRKMMQMLAGTVSAGYLSRTFGQTIETASAPAIPPAPTPIPAPAGFGVAAGPFQPNWESLAANYQVPDWYRNAKFGIWAHWGPQCQPEMGDWYAQRMYQFNSADYQFHVQHYGHPSKFGFKDVCNIWKAENWDPAALIALYKKAGAKFFAAMANHHDNMDMFDSTYQPWNSVKVGPKKDIVGGWAKAVRDAGLRLAISSHASHTWDWMQVAQDSDPSGEFAGIPYDGRISKADGKGKWWDGLDPQDLYAQYHAKGSYNWDLSARTSRGRGRRGSQLGTTPPVDPAYIEKFFNRTIDLINKYQPDLLYFDDTILPIYPTSDIGLRIAAYLYNTSFARNGKVDTVMTGKGLREEVQRRAMVNDIERGVASGGETHAWQTDTCIGEWHYRRSIYEQHRYKTSLQVVQMLIDIVSKNGNLMLSVPVRGDGTIDDDEVKIVEGIGEWMASNSEGIYATRPWKVYGEGPSVSNSSPRGQFGGSRDVRSYSAEDIRFTAKGDILYAFAMGWPESGKITIKSLALNSKNYPMDVAKVELLGTGQLAFTREAAGLVVSLPDKKPNDYAYTLKITPKQA